MKEKKSAIILLIVVLIIITIGVVIYKNVQTKNRIETINKNKMTWKSEAIKSPEKGSLSACRIYYN